MTVALGRGLAGLLARSAARPDPVPVGRWTVGCAAALPVLSTGGWLVAGALQPPSYSPLRQTVSVMAGLGGTDRWVVATSLYLMAACYLAVAAGLTTVSAAARGGLLVSALAAVGVASFPVPVHGADVRHEAFTAVGAVALAAWPLLVARSAGLDLRVSVAAGTVSMALLVWTLAEAWFGDALGLAERVSTSLQVCWPAVVALTLSRCRPDTATRGPTEV